MSIFKGKNGYDSNAAWTERSRVDELRRIGQYEYETALTDGPDPCITWLREELGKLPANPDILEVGSGFGGWSKKLEGLYNTFTGAEVMAERVAHARSIRKGDNISFHHIASPDWNLSRTFPVIICITVIQHLPVPFAIDVLKAIERHLAPGGTALMSEGRIYECSIEEAEMMYSSPTTAEHMIPKPLSLLHAAVPSLEWEYRGLRHVLRRP